MSEEQGAVAQLSSVCVRYGAVSALSGITVRLHPGATGLLGPNGAGKSTLLRTLLGLVRPAGGTIQVLGHDVVADPLGVRARVGYMPERDGPIDGVTAVDFVSLCAELAGLPHTDAMQRAHEVLYYVGLGDARYRQMDSFSPGMRQRVRLAQALVHDPDLLLLDEPTAGLDPTGREEMLSLMCDLAQHRGISLLVSSHLLPDIERTCTRVIMLDRGEIVADGPMAVLADATGEQFDVRVKHGAEVLVAELLKAGARCQEREGGVIRVSLPAGGTARDLFVRARQAGLQVRLLQPVVPTLDDAFARVLQQRR